MRQGTIALLVVLAAAGAVYYHWDHVRRADADIARLQSELEQARKQVADAGSRHAQEASGARGAIEALTRARDEALKTAETQGQEIRGLAQQVQEGRRVRERLERDIAELRATIATLNDTIATMRAAGERPPQQQTSVSGTEAPCDGQLHLYEATHMPVRLPVVRSGTLTSVCTVRGWKIEGSDPVYVTTNRSSRRLLRAGEEATIAGEVIYVFEAATFNSRLVMAAGPE